MHTSSQTALCNLSSWYESGVGADFRIICRGHCFRVNRAFISQQDGYFGTLMALTKGVADSVDFSYERFDPEVIEAVIHHLYGIRYTVPVTSETSASTQNCATFHAAIYGAAAHFDTPVLKQLALGRFRARARLTADLTSHRLGVACADELERDKLDVEGLTTDDTSTDVIAGECNMRERLERMDIDSDGSDTGSGTSVGLQDLGHQSHYPDSQRVSRLSDAAKILSAAKIVWEATLPKDRGMRDIVVKTCLSYPELMVDNHETRAWLESVPGLAVDLALCGVSLQHHKNSINRKRHCDDCNRAYVLDSPMPNSPASFSDCCPSCGSNQTYPDKQLNATLDEIYNFYAQGNHTVSEEGDGDEDEDEDKEGAEEDVDGDEQSEDDE